MKENKKAETLNEIIGKRLKDLRKGKQMTQQRISMELSISNSTYNRYETGKSEIPLDRIVELSKFFDVTLDYLLMGIEKEKEISPDKKIAKALNLITPKEKRAVYTLMTSIADSLKEK